MEELKNLALVNFVKIDRGVNIDSPTFPNFKYFDIGKILNL